MKGMAQTILMAFSKWTICDQECKVCYVCCGV